jgi:hypothetical protein
MKTVLSMTFAFLLGAVPLFADDAVLPTGYPVTRYTDIWENSPFNREVVKAAAKTMENSFAGSLVLEGLVTDDTLGPIAYVRDVREDKPIVITREKSGAHPFTIVSATQVANPEETKVTVTDGTETGEIGYVVAKLTQAIAAPAPSPAAQQQQRQGQSPTGRDGKGVPSPPGGGGAGGISPALSRNPPGSTPAAKPGDANKPTSVAPALENLDSEPRRRRVPLPGG